MSGMAFITAPPLKVVFEDYNITDAYVGFENGFFYRFPDMYYEDKIEPLILDE